MGSAFVDDANMYVFGKHLDTVSKLYAEAVEHVSAWATMLLVTGGCVKVRKSYLFGSLITCMMSAQAVGD